MKTNTAALSLDYTVADFKFAHFGTFSYVHNHACGQILFVWACKSICIRVLLDIGFHCLSVKVLLEKVLLEIGISSLSIAC